MIATTVHLTDTLSHRLRAEGDAQLVIWLDPDRHFERIAVEGSYPNLVVLEPLKILAQRLLLENAVPGTIIYAASRETLEPLEEIVQCFSTIRTFDVDDLMADRGVPRAAGSTLQARAHPDLLLSFWDHIGSGWWIDGDIDLGLALALRDRADGDAVDLALAELDRAARGSSARRPTSQTASDRFVALVLQERFGLEVPGTAEALARFALVTDYASVPSGCDRFAHLLEKTNRTALVTLVQRLAESRKRLERVREILHYAQEALQGSSDGFSIGELAKLRLAPGRAEALAVAIGAEADKAGPSRAFDVLYANEAALRDDDALPALIGVLDFDKRLATGRSWLAHSHPSSQTFIEAYVDNLSEIDRLYRHCVGGLEGALRLACETHYREWLRDLNVAFASRLDVEPTWHFRNPQRALGISFGSLQGRCAVVILDALRFEMGRDVFDRLHKTTLERRLEWSVATLPTKTEVGMSALVPSDEPLALAADGTKLVVRIGARVTTTKSVRDEIWRAAGFRVLWNGDLEREKIEDERIVVFHDAVDAIGETLQDDAFLHYEQLITSIAKLINDLARRGYAVIATADHGFLTLPPSSSNKLKLAKAGEDEVRKRRYRISPAETLPEPVVSRSATALGVEGEVIVGFPPGASIFQTQGALGFVHGGIALQELVIPVLRVSSKKVAPANGELSFAVQFPRRLTARRIAVALMAKTPVAAGTALRLRVRTSDDATADKKIHWTPDSQGRMVLTSWLAEDAPAGNVELQIMIDAGPLVAATNVDYEPHE